MDEHQVITGTIKDLSILAGIYNPVRRSDWIYQVKIIYFIFYYLYIVLIYNYKKKLKIIKKNYLNYKGLKTM